MLELLYATGMRVSELLHLNLEDINLQLGYVVCHDEEKERVIPVGNVCRNAMDKYLKEARRIFVKENETQSLLPTVQKVHEQTGVLESAEGICGRSRNPA